LTLQLDQGWKVGWSSVIADKQTTKEPRQVSVDHERWSLTLRQTTADDMVFVATLNPDESCQR
jgi:hypothetical protein